MRAAFVETPSFPYLLSINSAILRSNAAMSNAFGLKLRASSCEARLNEAAFIGLFG
jgi:hypothetical protein